MFVSKPLLFFFLACRREDPVAFLSKQQADVPFLLTKTKKRICLALNHELDIYGCFLKQGELYVSQSFTCW